MKRILALMLCLFILCPAALGEVYVADSYGSDETMSYSMLIRDDGTALTPPRIYSNIYRITPDGTPEADARYAVSPIDLGLEYDPATAEDMLYEMGYTRLALMDAQGNLLTDFDYESLDYDNGYVTFSLPGDTPMVGGMDPDGNVVVEPVYGALRHLGGGRWLGMAMPEDESAIQRIYDDEGGHYDVIDFDIVCVEPDGSVRPLGLHTTDRYFNVNAEGISVIWNVDEYAGESVYIDGNGEIMFDKGFRYAEVFEGDHAVVSENGLYGLIDRRGEYVIDPVYDYISTEPGKPTVATRGRTFTIYDPQSLEVLATLEYDANADVSVAAVCSGLLGVVQDGTTGIYDTSGKLLFEAPKDSYVQLYGYIGDDIERLVVDSGEWPDEFYRLVDLEGNVRSGDYRMINNVAWKDGHGRFVTGDYRITRDAQGEPTVDFSTYRYGLIDEDGETLLPMIYDDLRALSFDRYWAVMGDVSGMIDTTGKWYYTVSDYDTLMD